MLYTRTRLTLAAVDTAGGMDLALVGFAPAFSERLSLCDRVSRY